MYTGADGVCEGAGGMKKGRRKRGTSGRKERGGEGNEGGREEKRKEGRGGRC